MPASQPSLKKGMSHRRASFHDVDLLNFDDDDDIDDASEADTNQGDETDSSPNDASKNWAKLRVSVRVAGMMHSIAKRKQKAAIAWAASLTVMAGCSACVPFELLNKADRGCSELILFAQYLFASAEARNRLYNAALDMQLPMPVYLVLKNSGLVVSMCMGFAIQGKKYGKWQVAGVIVITVGVILATFAARSGSKSGPSAEVSVDTTFMLALGLMAAGVLVTALMNVVQEAGFSRYGKHFEESIFYANVMGLPVFLMSGSTLASHASTWTKTWYALPFPAPFNFSIPHLWLLLLVNIASQSVMKISCLKLTALAGSVPNVVTVTAFRFIALALSAAWLNSPPFPPLSFWVGGVMILGGTLAYALLAPKKAAADKKKN